MPAPLTTKKIIKRFKIIHDNRYNYSRVKYKTLRDKVCIICPTHGEFWQTPESHINKKSGCHKCGIESRSKKRSLGKEEFVSRSILKHGSKYDYSKVEYKNRLKKVCIICPIHGEFWQIPENHFNGHGCAACSNNKKYNTESFIEKSTLIHNNKYDYSKVEYKNSFKKIKIKCKKHGMFEQSPYHHIQGNGCPNCKISNMQNDLYDFISNITSFKIYRNTKSIITPMELDIFIPEKNLAIELDGLYWHSEQCLKQRIKNPRTYHLKKTKLCEENGIRLIHIFEDEWVHKQEIVKNRIKHLLGIYDNRIGGRQVKIKEINSDIKNNFLNQYHIQGTDKSSIKLGAFYKNRLIAVMTFSKPRIALGSKNNNIDEYELSRFATVSNTSTPGMANKMFSHFIKNYNTNKIYSYSDKRWNTGRLYEEIGMIFSKETQPNYWYIDNQNRFHRFNYRKSLLKNKLENFNLDLTEYENMLSNGYDRIWDCGNNKYELIH